MNYYLHIDSRPSCIDLQGFFEENFGDQRVSTPQEADVIIVGGGDGWMLRSMRSLMQYDKPLLGVNCGTLGFLLNRWDEGVWKTLARDDLSIVTVPTVEVTVTTHSGGQHAGFFFNDAIIGGSVLDYSTFEWMVDGQRKQVKGTGLVINTMLGSTGYALNLGQPLIPVDADLWGVVGIATAPFRYQFLQPQEYTIRCAGRKPITVGLDGVAEVIEEVSEMVFRPGSQSIQLAFFPGQSFAQKRVLLAQEKMG